MEFGELDMSKTILLVVDKDWSVVRWVEEDGALLVRKNGHDDEVYAEHTTCCGLKPRDGEPHDIDTWCWEYADGVWNDGWEVCWRCETRVSEGAVALVTMMNMDKPHR